LAKASALSSIEVEALNWRSSTAADGYYSIADFLDVSSYFSSK
jgi:hypothetical protein